MRAATKAVSNLSKHLKRYSPNQDAQYINLETKHQEKSKAHIADCLLPVKLFRLHSNMFPMMSLKEH